VSPGRFHTIEPAAVVLRGGPRGRGRVHRPSDAQLRPVVRAVWVDGRRRAPAATQRRLSRVLAQYASGLGRGHSRTKP
jgi:hypothetical protein